MVNLKLSKKGILYIALVIFGLGAIAFLGSVILRSASPKGPVELTESFMKKYKNASSEVMDKIKYPYDDVLTDEQFNKYKEIIKTQYLALDYKIVDTPVIGDIDAIVKVEFEVLDYASSYDKASSYLSIYEPEMTEVKRVDYKLKEMQNTKEKVSYSIEFKYYKLDGEWKMTDLSKATLSKLDGTF